MVQSIKNGGVRDLIPRPPDATLAQNWSRAGLRACGGLPRRAAACALPPPDTDAPRRLAVFGVALALLALGAGLARAAVGIGTSGPATIDTARPVVTLDALPPDLLLLGGQTVNFHWTTSDAHPGTTAADYTAAVRDGSTPLTTIDYLATPSETTWQYEAPEISSGYLNLLVTCRDAFGNTTTARSEDFSVILSTSGVPVMGLPSRPVLEGNLPNPCNPGTTVRFSLPTEQAAVLELYAADGARVRRLAAGTFPAGRSDVFWDGRDDGGRAVASGTYLLRLSAGGLQQARKLTLVR